MPKGDAKEDYLNTNSHLEAKVARLMAQLAESQARELRLREWMDGNAEHATHCIRVQEDERGCTCGLSELLTLQQDDSALREMIEAAKAEERAAIIAEMPGGHSVDPQWVCDMIRARGDK